MAAAMWERSASPYGVNGRQGLHDTVRLGAKRCERLRENSVAGALFKADYDIECVNISGTVLARLRSAQLLSLPPMRALIMHEEDRKFDVRLKAKSDSGGNRLFYLDRRVCAKAE
jgi:hypothetical protein